MGRTDAQIRECPLDRLSGTVVKTAGIRLGANLNSGGWGTVYLGRLVASAQSPMLSEAFSSESKIKRLVHRSLFRQPSRLFAVKVLQTAHTGRDKEMQNEEARLHFRASSSRHPGVVKLHQVIREPTFTFLVLDYCPGGDLFGAIMTRRFYGDVPAVKSIFMQLADALQFLHSISIFHRDLKPENVLITSQRGEPPTVAIADFGLSSDAPMSSIELGSIHYMSPECLGRYGKYYPEYSCSATDVWALGVVMLALVLDRVLPWNKAIDDCEAFRDFSFDTHRWFMRRWNFSEQFNALLVRMFELNPYHRIAASSIPRKVEKLDYFIGTPEETRLALQRYSDAEADLKRQQEMSFFEGRYRRQTKYTSVFHAASSSLETARSILPGSVVLQRVSTISTAKRGDSSLPRPLQPTPDPGALGLTGMGLAADTTDRVAGSSMACPLPANADERMLQEALIAAHRLEDIGMDVATTVFPPQRLRSSSFVRRPSPLRSSLALDPEPDEVEGTSHASDDGALVSVGISDAPPLVADDGDDEEDDAAGDDPNSSDMPSTPRNRLASIPELQGAAGVAENLPPPETRRGSLPRLRPLAVLSGLGMETFSSSKPSALLAKTKAVQPHKARRDVGFGPLELPPASPEDVSRAVNEAPADFEAPHKRKGMFSVRKRRGAITTAA